MSESFQIAVVGVVVVFLIITLYKEFLRPVLAFIVAIVTLLVFGVLTPEESISGFANEQLVVIMLLLVLGNIISQSKITTWLFGKLLKQEDSPRRFLSKMMLSVGAFSAFLNNTPLVAIFMPYVNSWAKARKTSVSKMLIPLSYASILGGSVTLIGTSTNLIVNGLAMEMGEESLAFFDFVSVGLPMLVVGLLYLFFFSNKLLPNKKDVMKEMIAESRNYFIETQIPSTSHIDGKTVETAGLRNLQGLYLVEILRGKRIITPVAPEQRLEKGDTLFFAGDPKSVSELTSPKMGLSLPVECELPAGGTGKFTEVVISHNSVLVGQKVRNSDFRGRYNGAILAIHRNGEKLFGKIGEQILRAGDVLMVLTGRDFHKRTKNSQAFYAITFEENEEEGKGTGYRGLVFLGLVIAITLSILGLVSLFISLAVLVMSVLLFKLETPEGVRKGFDYELFVIIAFGLALGKAIVNSGAGELLATTIFDVLEGGGAVVILGVIFIITNILSAFITGKAAVSIVLPISLLLAKSLGTPVTPFILVVAFGGVANFMTPIGYQTNLMVYGPGGYSFKDFFRIGLPLTVIYLVVCVGMLAWQYNL